MFHPHDRRNREDKDSSVRMLREMRAATQGHEAAGFRFSFSLRGRAWGAGLAASLIVSQTIFLLRLAGRGGFGWDDVALREWGHLNLSVVLSAVRQGQWNTQSNVAAAKLTGHFDRDKGAWFDLALAALEVVTGRQGLIESLMLRQQATVVVWAVGSMVLYGIVRKLFGVEQAVWGTALYGTMPYLLGNALVNSKDVTFLVAYLVAVDTLIRANDRRTPKTFAAHGAALGLLVATRSIGMLLLGVSVVLLTVGRKKLGEERRTSGGRLAVAGVVSAVSALVVLWPALWFKPLETLRYSLVKNAAYPSEGTVLYMGDLASQNNLPWHYMFVSIAITTPTLWLVLIIVSLLLSCLKMARATVQVLANGKFFAPHAFNARGVFVLSYLSPIVAVILLGSTLYDGWRHLLFVAPSLIVLMLWGASELAKIGAREAKCRRSHNATALAHRVGLLAVVTVGLTAYVSAVPYASVYKNTSLFGGYVEGFEDDYWALATMELIEAARAIHADGSQLQIHPAAFMPTYPIARYAAHGEESVAFVDSYESANYAVTTFRGIQDRKGHLDELHMFGYPVHEVVVQGRVVGILFRRHT